jgi:selenocysteine lyase/cysteine desulfurase
VTEEKINAVRVSLHVFNYPAQCDRLVAAVAKIIGS